MRVNRESPAAKLEYGLYQSLLEGLDTPRALTCSLLARSGQWEDLLALVCDPLHYNDAHQFADDYLATAAMSKNERLPLGLDRREVAVGKFYAAESLCAETNKRIHEFRENPHSAGLAMVQLVPQIQWIINRILNSHPSHHDLEFCEESMRFGPGATTSCSGIVTKGRKFSKRVIDCTPELVSFRAFCFPDLWKENVKELRLREYSKLTTVPKNAKTDRVICIEPDLNIFVQLGIGAVIRRKLRVFGLDLNTQENNQTLAAKAWERGLCTVDLSSASDTIASETVRLLLPPLWVELLELPRVRTTQMPDKTLVRLEKWSSMGNGYTFELETLIFYAVALSVTPVEQWNDVIAYGDDIILPVECYPLLVSALSFLGFKVNKEKTFGKGLFHESCGTDWFRGINVRPFFLRNDFHDPASACYLYANNARRWAHRRNGGGSCDARVLPFWIRCFTAVGPKHRHAIPEGIGDGGFVLDFDRAVPSLNRSVKRRGWGGYRFFYRRIGMRRTHDYSEGAYIAALSGRNSSEWTRGSEDLRGRYGLPATRLGYSLEWPNLGPWL